MTLKSGKNADLSINHQSPPFISRLRHALSEKENAQQQRDDMEVKLDNLTQQKCVQGTLASIISSII